MTVSFFSPSESGVSVKRSLLVVPVVAVLALSACESASSAPATSGDRVIESTTAAPAAPIEREPVSLEDVLEATLLSEGIHTPAGFAAQYADIVCTGFDDGLDLYDMVAIGHQEIPRYSVNEHAFMVGASVGTFCPEHAGEVGR